MDVKLHYQNLRNNCNDILDCSLEGSYSILIAESHNFLFDFDIWLKILNKRPEYNILKTAIKEYQISILSANLGLYSQSFVGLRFFLERSLVAILFSANEIEFKLWEKGERDTYWSELMDENTGVFSHKFSRAFFPDLKDELKHFKIITEKVYRECSEYVHGNNSALVTIPEILKFDDILIKEWHKKSKIIQRIILFAFNLRFANSIPAEDLKKLEDLNIENFGHIRPIQNLY